jgi:hypothetical protein
MSLDEAVQSFDVELRSLAHTELRARLGLREAHASWRRRKRDGAKAAHFLRKVSQTLRLGLHLELRCSGRWALSELAKRLLS